MKKLFLFIIASILILVSSFYLVSRWHINKEDSIQSLTKVSVRLKWIHQAQFAGYYYAKEQDLYKSSGLDVELLPGGPDISPIQAVVSRSSDFGIIGADQIILARSKGVPVVAVAVIYKKSPVALHLLKKAVYSPLLT